LGGRGREAEIVKLTAEQLGRRVREEWIASEPIPNPHGLRLDRNLLSPPVRRQFKNSLFQRDAQEPFRSTEHLDLWMVVDEDPGVDGGYLIVYDDGRDQYGLAVKSGIFLGYYGSLAETIAGM
jgi:hypothetical protein